MHNCSLSPRGEDLWFKIEENESKSFKKMFVRYKKKSYTLGLEDNDFIMILTPLETEQVLTFSTRV